MPTLKEHDKDDANPNLNPYTQPLHTTLTLTLTLTGDRRNIAHRGHADTEGT